MSSLMPFFCFYGGKWRIALKYPLPKHDHIIEPFAGAAGYSTRHAGYRVTLVEKDPIIAALWRYLISVSSAEILNIPLIENDQTVDDLHGTSIEARYLVGFWLNKGTSGPCKRPSTWMRKGLRPKSFWGPQIRSRIAVQVEKIKHWKIIEGTYTDAPEVEATWYIDPPYMHAGRNYRQHVIDYEHLASWSANRQGQVMVCENVGAQWLPFEPFISCLANNGRCGGKHSAEALWLKP